MPGQEIKTYKVLDWLIVSFFVIFLLSLSNSIFVNQVGYFGALLFILVKAFLTRKNPFSNTGLELAFALYMIAEILSLIFSDYKAEAFHHFTKRALLIPVVYTTIAATTSFKLGKNFFTLFIVGALITALIYLIASAQYFINNLYVTTLSGPSLFQHPITASEIISFVVLFLFAFIINEKAGWKIKLLLYSGFAVSLLTLVATYKRTGWLGVAVGIVLLLIIKRKWKILSLVLLAGVILFLTDKNISQVNVYSFEGSTADKLYSLNTEGRAWSVEKAENLLLVSDYENGLLLYRDSVLIKHVATPGPASAFLKITDSLFLANLTDTCFLIFKVDGESLKPVNEILTMAEITDFVVSGQSLYTLDPDSGLTFYESVTAGSKPVRLPEFNAYRLMFIDSLNFFFISESSGIAVYSKNENLPGTLITKNENINTSRAYFFNGNLVFGNSDGLNLFALENNEIVLKDHLSWLKMPRRLSSDMQTLAVLVNDGTIFKFRLNDNFKLELLAKDKISPIPANFNLIEGKLYCTYIKRGRLLSFFDPHLPQNFTRLALWRAGWKIFKDHPLFGVGDIDLAKYYVKYKRPYDKEIHGHMHNNYIHFLVTLGSFGFLVMMYLIIMIIIKISGIYKWSKGKPFIASYSLGTLASFVCILVAGLSELNFWDHEIATLIYFTVGLNIALFIRHKEVADNE
jgi:O-antigen ligase